MKSIITNVINKKHKVPKLFISKEGRFVVLATKIISEGVFEGMVVHSQPFTPNIGYYYDEWDQEDFTPFNGKVELVND